MTATRKMTNLGGRILIQNRLLSLQPGWKNELPAGTNELPAGKEETADEETTAPDSTRQGRVARELRKLGTFYNPTENATEIVLLSSDPGTPRNAKEAGTCEERDSWKASQDKEYDNFNKRKAWKQVDRASFPQPKDLGNEKRLQGPVDETVQFKVAMS
jgi:hypothetical protein